MFNSLLQKYITLRIIAENPLSTLCKIFFLPILRIRKTIPIKLLGETIYIRTSTPDLRVVRSSFGKEFELFSSDFHKTLNGLIIDAGGYIGTTAIALAKLFPNATIVSIEPSTDNFRLLQKNIQGYPNIKARNAALTADSDLACVELFDRGTGNWGFTLIDKPKDSSVSPLEKADALTVDKILDEYGFDKIMVFKMDIEGSEFFLFQQNDWLEKTSILVVELHERIISGCEQAFKDANKSRFIIKSSGEKWISVGKLYFE